MAGTENEGAGAQWRSLHGALISLRQAIAREEDPEKRAELLVRLKATQEAIAEYERTPESRTQIDPDEDVEELLSSLGVATEGSTGPGRGRHTREPDRGRSPIGAVALGAIGTAVLLGMATFGWWFAQNRSNDDAGQAQEIATSVEESAELDALQVLLDVMGQTTVDAELRGSVVYLVGAVASEDDRDAILSAAERLTGGLEIDASELVVIESMVAGAGADASSQGEDPRGVMLQQELDRVLSLTPIVFTSGQTDLTTLQLRLLNTVAGVLLAYPDIPVNVVGYTDGSPEETANSALSLDRAEVVRNYLISQGVPEAMLIAEGRGEDASAGSPALAGLERRVELEVVAGASAPADMLLVGVVAPSARNDLAFSQSIVDAVSIVARERGSVEVEIVDNVPVPGDAAAAMRGFAGRGFDLVIVHGSQFGEPVLGTAADYPDVTFAWGPVGAPSETANVYTYDVAAEEGGYVLGAVAAQVTTSDVVGIVGSIEVADSQRYVEGFEAGVKAQNPGATVLAEYAGSFSDVSAAAELAIAHIDAGADVLTGTSELSIGAISVAQENGLIWFANQSDQTILAPATVAAAQVYRWEVALRPIFTDLDAGSVEGRLVRIDLANGGLIIEYNAAAPTSQEALDRAAEITSGIVSGAINPLSS